MNLMSNIPNFNSSSLFDQEKLNSIDPLENQLCRVCEEPAAGFHFGAFTCEGCKSFFGRSCNNQTVIQECKNNYRCVVDRKNRTSCKACRLRKCLLVGMSKSGCRYGRRSNWFKIHCLMQKNVSKPSAAPYPMFPQNPRLGNADAILNHADAILNSVKPSQSRSPSPLNNSSESLSIHSSPSPSAPLEAPVSPPTFSLAPSMLYDQPPSMVERHSLYNLSPGMLDQYNSHHKISSSPASLLEQQQHSLYKLSPLLAVHPLLLAANPLFKMDFSAQLEILKQRRAMFEALRSSGPEQENGPATTETPIDLSCK